MLFELAIGIPLVISIKKYTWYNMHSVTSNAVANELNNIKVYGITFSGEFAGWLNAIPLGVLRGKYEINIFQKGGNFYSVQSVTVSYANGNISDDTSITRVIDIPNDNNENVSVALYVATHSAVNIEVVINKIN